MYFFNYVNIDRFAQNSIPLKKVKKSMVKIAMIELN